MTTTNQVSLGKFYQFLNQQGINTAEDVVNAMDGVGDFGNADGVVIKAEFSAFMKDTWDELLLGEMSDKAINSFWNSIDTQKSAKTVGGTKMKDLNALNENEAAAVEKQIACYEVLNQFMANVALPAEACGLGIDNRAFKNSINDSLMETCQRVITANKNKSVDEIRQLIQEALAEAYPTAEKKTVANLLANGDNGLIKLLSSKPELANLENKAFDDLQAIVDKYIQNRAADPNINLAQVINELTYIINQYFVNAGVNTGITANVNNPSELNEYTQFDGMSDLQNARLSAKMNEALASANLNTGDLQCPQEYVDHYKEVFSESKVNSGMSFTNLMNQNNLANEFVNFQINGVTVKKLIDLHINAANMNVDWVFHECLCDKPNDVNETGVFYGMSEAAADAIFANLPFTDLPKSAHQKIMDGEIKSKKDLYDYYVEEIKKDLAKYVGGSSALSVEDAYNIYNDSYNSIRADQTSSASEKLTNLKKAAITFCDTIAAKGDIVKNAIKQVFGTEDYKSKINNSSTPSEIHGWVTQLKDKVKDIDFSADFDDSQVTGTANIDAVSIDYALMPADDDIGWKTCKDNFMSKIKTIANKLKSAAIQDGYNETRADNAAKTFVEYYNYAMDQLSGFGSTSEHHLYGGSFGYTDHNLGSWQTSTDQSRVCGNWSEKNVDDAGNLGYSSGSDTGIFLGVNINSKVNGYTVFVNPDTLKAKFKAFLH